MSFQFLCMTQIIHVSGADPTYSKGLTVGNAVFSMGGDSYIGGGIGGCLWA